MNKFEIEITDFNSNKDGVYSRKILSSNKNSEYLINSALICLKPGASTNRHNHHEHELLIFIEGSGEVFVDRQHIFVQKGSSVNLQPLQFHKIHNNSSVDLLLLSIWWFDKQQFSQKIIPKMMNASDLIKREYRLISAFPTPNGPLHLGHIAGPYIAFDILFRYLKLQNANIIKLFGLDQNDPWVDVSIAKSKSDTKEFLNTVREKIMSDMATLNIDVNNFVLPAEDAFYDSLCKKISSKLYAKKFLYSESKPIPLCKHCLIYLYGPGIFSECASCNENMHGNICENCNDYISDSELIHPKCSFCKNPVSFENKEVLVSNLENYRSFVMEHLEDVSTDLNSQLYITKVLSKKLPTLPFTHFGSWGIKCSIKGFESQRLPYYLEHIARLILACQPNESSSPGSISEEVIVIRFFGCDNQFFYNIVAPILIKVFFENCQMSLKSLTNKFYMYNGMKFSTSKKHAVWVSEFSKKFPIDAIRAFLTKTRPAYRTTEFTEEKFLLFYETVLVKKWGGIICSIHDNIVNCFEGRVPEAGSWNRIQILFYQKSNELISYCKYCLSLDNFLLDEYFLSIENFFESIERYLFEHYESDFLGMAYKRTQAALQMMSIVLIANIVRPIMPNFSRYLTKTFDLEESQFIVPWGDLPQLLNNKSIQTRFSSYFSVNKVGEFAV